MGLLIFILKSTDFEAHTKELLPVTVKCIFCNSAFAGSLQYESDNQLHVSDKLILNNLDIISIDTNPKENLLYILGIEQKKQNEDMAGNNVVFVVDTKSKKIIDKIQIHGKNLHLDNILFDDKNDKLYGIGTKEIKNNTKLSKTNFIFEISSLEGKSKIVFNNITTSSFSTESEDNDETGILDMDIDIKYSNMYILLANNSMIEVQNIISGEQDQTSTRAYKTIDNLQIHIIPYGNRIINNPQERVNYVLVNGIKSSDKDIVLVLNESTSRIIKNYTLPSLNSRNPVIDFLSGKLYILGDYFAYNYKIKGFSKQSELITVIDSDSTNVLHFSLGRHAIKDFIVSPKNDVLYAITKGPTNSQQPKSDTNHLLEINPMTGVINDIALISLDANDILVNDISQTLFIIGKDSQDGQNKVLFIQPK
jgi:hypothetical protein